MNRTSRGVLELIRIWSSIRERFIEGFKLEKCYRTCRRVIWAGILGVRPTTWRCRGEQESSTSDFLSRGPSRGIWGVEDKLSGEAEETIDQGMATVDDVQQRKIKAQSRRRSRRNHSTAAWQDDVSAVYRVLESVVELCGPDGWFRRGETAEVQVNKQAAGYIW